MYSVPGRKKEYLNLFKLFNLLVLFSQHNRVFFFLIFKNLIQLLNEPQCILIGVLV